MRALFVLIVAAVVTAAPAAAQAPAKSLQIYYIDTEGGQATLFVAPSFETLLVDVGNPGGRDTDRIMLALEDAGVKQIDHGPAAEGDRAGGQGFMEQYAQIHANALRTVVKPGDKIAIPGLDITVVSSAGQVLKSHLSGAGRPNPACAGFVEKDLSKVFDPDNAYSVGFVLGFGRFRTIDLGDLTWSELALLYQAKGRSRGHRSILRRTKKKPASAPQPYALSPNNKKPETISHLGLFHLNTPGSDLLSHAVSHTVPSTVAGLTSVFGMGTGVALLL